MKICRACLAASESEPLIPFDDTFLIYYNSLTNLNVTLDDSLPKYCCQSCVGAVNFFAQFRKKCTENENTLRAAVEKTILDKHATQFINEQATNDIKPDIVKTEDNYINNFDSIEEEEECYEELFYYVEDDCCSIKEDEIGSETNNSNNTEKDNDDKLITELCTTTFVRNEPKNRKARSKIKSTKAIDKTRKVADKRKAKYNKNKKALVSKSSETSENTSLLCDNDDKLITELCATTFLKNEPKNRKGRSKIKSTKGIEKTRKVADKRNTKYNKNKKALVSKFSETSENTSLLCGICTKKDFDEKSLETHLENHKTSKQCELCEEKVWSWPQLFGHRLQHLPKPQQKCHLCGRGYRSSAYLEFHYLNLHNDGQEKIIKCNKCWRICATPRKLSQHLQAVHSNMIYTCDYCSKSFRAKNILLKHIVCHSEQKAFKCDMCPFACKLSTGLSIHKLHRHNPTKVICKQCGRPFISKEKMDLHSCRSRSVICPVCGKSVARNHGLIQHMESHKSVGKYKCDRCPAVYKTSSGLKTHINQHDGIRDKKCEFCPATFFYSSVLVKHRRIHTGEKPYVCEVCSKSFTGKHNLKVHMQIHGEFIINKKNKMDISSSELK